MIPLGGRLGHEERRIISCRVLFHQLSAEGQELIRLAYLYRHNAQAFLSGFHVGASVLSDQTGEMYVGCNVERGTFTQTTHAEQNALDTLIAEEGSGAKISAIAIVAAPTEVDLPEPGSVVDVSSTSKEWVRSAPCGHCLQCIVENARSDQPTWLISYLADGTVCVTTIASALPYAFVFAGQK
ncbi:hypothetical protein KKF05_02980 [Patescibacteria group bacterium]|nr:hypothetical protein [Patescibacteria group bacterium]MBU1028604.1 hypothetical protein [Patescibacteria group bacterium]MBU1915565.1 hypothetical protein [Patescibacteria group bacterium]